MCSGGCARSPCSRRTQRSPRRADGHQNRLSATGRDDHPGGTATRCRPARQPRWSRLNADLTARSTRRGKEVAARAGFTPAPGTPEEFAAQIAATTSAGAPPRSAGVKADWRAHHPARQWVRQLSPQGHRFRVAPDQVSSHFTIAVMSSAPPPASLRSSTTGACEPHTGTPSASRSLPP